MMKVAVAAILLSVGLLAPAVAQSRTAQIRALQQGLRSVDFTSRLTAARELAAFRGHVPVTLLMQALRDDNWPVRRAAAESLAGSGQWGRAAAALLVESLRDADVRVRRAAQSALLELGVDLMPTTELLPLLPLIGRGRPAKQIAMVDVLGRRHADAALVMLPLVEILEQRSGGGDTVSIRRAKPAPDHRLAHTGVLFDAVIAVGRLGPAAVAAVPALAAITADRSLDPRLRAVAWSALRCVAPRHAVTKRMDSLPKDEPDVLQKTIQGERHLLDAAHDQGFARATLLRWIDSVIALRDNRDIQGPLRVARWWLDPSVQAPVPLPVDIDVALTELEAADEWTRAWAALRLGASGVGSDRTVGALAAQLQATRLEDRRALVTSDWEEVSWVLLTNTTPPPRLSSRAPNRYTIEIPFLPFAHPFPGLAATVAAADALGRLGQPAKSAVPRLLPLAADPSWQVRAAALSALGEIDPGALPEPALRAAQDDPRAEVRRAAWRLGSRR